MRQKVYQLGIWRRAGHIYFVQADGVYAMDRTGPRSRHRSYLVKRVLIERERGWFYFVDQDGDVSRAWIGGQEDAPRPYRYVEHYSTGW